MNLSPALFGVPHYPADRVRLGRIVVATNLTDAEYLVPHAIAQAIASGSQVTLVHVLPPSGELSRDESTATALAALKSFRDARMILLGLARQIEAKSIACETSARRGDLIEVIASEIARVDAISLVMGSRGCGGLTDTADSITRQLFAVLNVPIFSVGLHANDLQRVA